MLIKFILFFVYTIFTNNRNNSELIKNSLDSAIRKKMFDNIKVVSLIIQNNYLELLVVVHSLHIMIA